MRLKALALAACASMFPASLAAQDEAGKPGKVTPLFAEDSILDVTIRGPLGDVIRKAERTTAPQAAQLEANGEVLPVQISARGVSRRRKDVCKFPPLRVAFGEVVPEASLFRKQGNLKLVTHCNNKPGVEQTLLREYTTYRLLNLVTPMSHRVRLLRISYVDGDKQIASEFAFFIEDTDDAARRVGLKEVDTGKISPRSLNQDRAAQFALFQYMIGNTDWAMYTGPDPTDCCHNTKLLGAAKDAASDFTPVAYDFDNAGLVDAPYAVPNPLLKLRSVQQRVYRGFCMFNSYVPAHAARLRELRPALEAEIAAIPSLDARSQADMKRYLSGFYEDIADDATLQKKLLDDCR